MRKLKFRVPVYSHKTGIFVRFEYWDAHALCFALPSNPGSNDDIYKDDEQFTGRHDKNGKDIYEGDIVRQKSYNDRWNELGAVVYNIDCFLLEIDRHFHRNARIENDCEIIGTIHENPELLSDGRTNV